MTLVESPDIKCVVAFLFKSVVSVISGGAVGLFFICFCAPVWLAACSAILAAQ